MNLIFDIETDGLLDKVTKIHCLGIYDLDECKSYSFNDTGKAEPIVRGVQMLNDADCIIGHNVIGFDLVVIQKFYPWFKQPTTVIDTLLLSRLYHPNLLDIDKKHTWKQMPLQLYGRHSLEAYGYRLKEYKGCFSKDTDWSEWSQEMEDYMNQDVLVTEKLWQHFQKYLTGSL
jgi:DNA polymerase III alpha subunit (gram-positive type)